MVPIPPFFFKKSPQGSFTTQIQFIPVPKTQSVQSPFLWKHFQTENRSLGFSLCSLAPVQSLGHLPGLWKLVIWVGAVRGERGECCKVVPPGSCLERPDLGFLGSGNHLATPHRLPGPPLCHHPDWKACFTPSPSMAEMDSCESGPCYVWGSSGHVSSEQPPPQGRVTWQLRFQTYPLMNINQAW